MITITIPKKITRGEELVIIPRKDYEKLLKLPRKKKLDMGIEEALEDIKKGRISRPFDSAEKMIKSLQTKK